MTHRLRAAAIAPLVLLALGWPSPAPAAPPDALANALAGVVTVLPHWPNLDQIEEPQGSAVAIAEGGYLATAGHVVDRADAVAVRLADGRRLPATVVAIDRATDIAVLKVAADLPVLANAPPPVLGAPVCALANPFGVGLSVSCGVVSATARAGMGFNSIEDFIQTDAAINPGASGGALVDAEGRLVGMISAIFTRDADADIGINFAVSAAMLARVTGDLIAHGRVIRGRPGLRVTALDAETRTRHAGVRVAAIEPEGAAAEAGLAVGDIITTIAGRPVRKPADVPGAIHLHRPGETIPITLLRAGQRHDIALVLADEAAPANVAITGGAGGARTKTGAVGRLRAALDALCGDPEPAAARLASGLGGARVEDERVVDIGGAPGRWRAVLVLPEGGRLHLDRFFPGGRLRRLTVEYHAPAPGGGTRPRLQAVANADCAIIDARRLDYDSTGRASTLVTLAADLVTAIGDAPLNPPLPNGRDPGGVTVALFDSGINYTLPHLAGRLARDAAGRLVGYDYWDDDDRPYDSDTRGSPFFPLHHGSVVAGILVAEAPAVRLAPFRYPNPDLSRMAAMVAAAEAAGAVIVAMPMGSNRATDWTAFRDAAAARPDMLFILSAGNDGRDIDRDPVYPAAFGLDNVLVVTSATPFGKLAAGSNWGVEHVDLMVPAERLAIIDHRGAAGKASGSSYAVPRVAALAARLQAAHPDWRAAELKAAILARAHPSPYQRTRVTRYGWIANPADDG